MRPHSVAPWVRTRLRAAPLPAVALFLLVLVTAFLAAAFPRGTDTYESSALRDTLDSAGAARTTFELSTDAASTQLDREARERDLRPAQVRERLPKIAAIIPAPLSPDRSQTAYGAETFRPKESPDPELPRPQGLAPRFTVNAQDETGKHSRLRDGRLPEGDGVSSRSDRVEAAVTAETARTLNLKVGSVVHLPDLRAEEVAFEITGIVEPRQPKGSWWSYEPVLRTPELTAEPGGNPPKHYWHAALLIAPEAGPVLARIEQTPQIYWRLPPLTAELTAQDEPALRERVASLEHGPLLAELRTVVNDSARLGSDIDVSLEEFRDRRGAVTPIVAVAAFGIGAVAFVVLLMTAELAVARRDSELALLRARGGSLRGIAGRLGAETAVVVLPAAAVGLLLAMVAVPQGRAGPSVIGAAAVALCAVLALPVRAVVAHRRPRTHQGRPDLVTARPSRRRTVAELTLLVLAGFAVVALRQRGTKSGSGSADQLVSAAPVLLAVIAALLLVRLYPPVLRFVARPSARRRGLVGFVALARAGRVRGTQVLPLLALLTALATAAFGGSVLAGADGARDRAALLAVGADVRVSGPGTPLPGELTTELSEVPGLDEVAAVHVDPNLDLPDGSGATLIAVTPDTYARVSRDAGLGAFAADELAAPRSGALPALASPGVAKRLGSGKHSFRMPAGEFTARVTGVRDGTPAAPVGEFLLIDGRQLPYLTNSVLLCSGSGIDTAALRRTVRDAGGNNGVEVRAEQRARLSDSPLQSGAERMYTAAVLAGAGYAVLAVLLSLLQAAPERTALLARLRTMGLGRRQARGLLVLESLPQSLLAACGGALVGWSAIALLSPGIDLERLALTAASGFDDLATARLRTDPWSLLAPAGAVLCLAVAVSLAQAWWTARRTAATELRAGDAG
ncbi:FtsX-like permease family protein [Streptomyces sp. YIM 130001]|uniref:FtsX-like permease family protein n=1 Tax=Streptomyces sp. YIM 130001 TaxID=2259644 RepID=UPI000E654779|nr:ABC transporter permease [Streptomyces sp. YIM 130001]RII19526.1 FtsX-like permease family protein [Streptomyces sp. YIM 130001]